MQVESQIYQNNNHWLGKSLIKTSQIINLQFLNFFQLEHTLKFTCKKLINLIYMLITLNRSAIIVIPPECLAASSNVSYLD